MVARADSRGRTARLAEGCIACIEQCDELLRGMPEAVFAGGGGSPSGARGTESSIGARGTGFSIGARGAESSIGAHVRHIIDRYRCFFDGLDGACIDYDDRRRGDRIETEVKAATAALAATRGRFDGVDLASLPTEIQVRELVHYDGEPASAASTLDRELMGLVTHSIHHLAIIAMLARARGHPVPENLGKAPSTLAAG